MIRTFKCKDTENFFAGGFVKRFQAFSTAATRKLTLLDAANTLDDLKIPAGNRLEGLRGDREGRHSIRINQQYRICFRWLDDGAYDVEIVDYH